MFVAVTHRYEQPFAEFGLAVEYAILVQAASGKRPSIPEGTPMPFVELFQRCVDPNPDKRPTAAQVAEIFQSMAKAYKQSPGSWEARAYKNSSAPAGAAAPLPASTPAPAAAVNNGGTAFTGWGKKSVGPTAGPPPSAGTPIHAGEETSSDGGKFAGWKKKET